MPQFDQFSFFNQVSWFILYFLTFYFFITYFFLPNISYNLKIRKKKIISELKKKNYINFEKNNNIFFLNNFYKTFCHDFEFFVSKKFNIYKIIQTIKIQQKSLLNNKLNLKINNFLNQQYFFIKSFL